VTLLILEFLEKNSNTAAPKKKREENKKMNHFMRQKTDHDRIASLQRIGKFNHGLEARIARNIVGTFGVMETGEGIVILFVLIFESASETFTPTLIRNIETILSNPLLQFSHFIQILNRRPAYPPEITQALVSKIRMNEPIKITVEKVLKETECVWLLSQILSTLPSNEEKIAFLFNDTNKLAELKTNPMFMKDLVLPLFRDPKISDAERKKIVAYTWKLFHSDKNNNENKEKRT